MFVYVLLADDHVNNASYFPFMSIKNVVPYFCVLREAGCGNDDLPWLYTQPLQNREGAKVCIVLGK